MSKEQGDALTYTPVLTGSEREGEIEKLVSPAEQDGEREGNSNSEGLKKPAGTGEYVSTSLSALQGSREDSTNFCTVAVRTDKLPPWKHSGRLAYMH